MYPKSNSFSPPPVPIISHLDYCSMFPSLVSPFSPLPAPLQSVLNTAAQRYSTPSNLCSEHAAGSHLVRGEAQSPCSSLVPVQPAPLASQPPLLLLLFFTQLQPCRPQAYTSHVTFLFLRLCICHSLFPECFSSLNGCLPPFLQDSSHNVILSLRPT